jgi:hypothetical protein
MSYDWIYKLPIGKEVEPGWYKLKWRPIRRGTWNMWINTNKVYRWNWNFAMGLDIWRGGAHNGWGRSYDRLDVILHCGYWNINSWIHWNVIVHKDGPQDGATKRKLFEYECEK